MDPLLKLLSRRQLVGLHLDLLFQEVVDHLFALFELIVYPQQNIAACAHRQNWFSLDVLPES